MIRVLAEPQGSVLKHALLLWPIALLPSAALMALVAVSLHWMGVDLADLSMPQRSLGIGHFVGSVLFAPAMETLFLSLLIGLLSIFTSKPTLIASVSALVWGALHGWVAALWFFGTAWSFFVFSCGYLVWSRRSYMQGFLAAAIPHALVNLTGFGLLALSTAWKGTL